MQGKQKLLAIGALSAIPLAWTLVLMLGGTLQGLEERLLDFRFNRFNPGHQISQDVYMLEIDDQTFQVLEPDDRFGAWPWSRDVYAPIIEFISQGAPRRILFDIMFLGRTEADAGLADVTRATGLVSHAVNLRDPCSTLECRGFHPRLDGTLPPVADLGLPASLTRDSGAPRFNVMDAPTGKIGDALNLIHTVNFQSDADSIARRIPPLATFGGRTYPSLGLAAYLAFHPPDAIEVRQDLLRIQSGQEDLRIPLVDGQFLLNYYPKEQMTGGRFQRISMAAVLESKRRVETGDFTDLSDLPVSPLEFQDKIIIIGATAAATLDLKNTPYGRIPGPWLHAIMLSNLLQKDFVRLTPAWFNFLLALLLAPTGVYITLSAQKLWARILFPTLILAAVVLGAMLIFKFTDLSIGLAPFLVSYPFAFPAALALLTFIEGRDKFKFKVAMSKYLSPGVLTDVMSRTNLQAEVGRRRVMSVMFTDIRSFTTMSEQMDAAEVVKLLNEYLNTMVDIIFQHEGTLDKFIGDAIMAFWNAPNDQPDHARRAVLTGMEMVQALYQMHASWKARNLPLLHMGVGINSGEMIVGNIGGEKRLDYTVIGDNVNLGSRLEGITKNYGVDMIISQSCFEQLNDEIPARRLDLVAVKGKTKPIMIFEPLHPQSPPRVSGMNHNDYVAANNAAFEAYLQRDWKRAIDGYRSILLYVDGRQDSAAAGMITRCEDYQRNPPPEAWDGTLVMKTK
ncbi:MAG: adenylate/guanylate cyclase domain-containing protein [Leptospirales bacterium]|nr:adenylate/guanylate cyclase domain-containing protein [Leptospirales bacterium]